MPEWLSKRTVLYLHRRAIVDFGGHTGAVDEELLEAALARPQHKHACEDPDLAALAAAYGFTLALGVRRMFAQPNRCIILPQPAKPKRQ